jgi:hypothetical protein
MSRRAIPLAFATLLLAGPLAAAPVPPQPKADSSISPSAVLLLQQRKVQKELTMTAEQRVAVFDGLADIDEEHEKKLDALARKPDAPEEEYDKLNKERQKASEKLLADTAGKLTTAQRTRLQQFDWRLRGAAAFTDPRVEKKLQLTGAQKKKAAEVAERMKGALSRYLDGEGDEDDAKRKAELFDFRKARLKEMQDALTADQKTAWATMLGAAPTGFVVDDLWLKIEEDADLNLPPGVGK